jgi:hypothetical protein
VEVQRQLTAIAKAAADAMRMFLNDDSDIVAGTPTWKQMSESSGFTRRLRRKLRRSRQMPSGNDRRANQPFMLPVSNHRWRHDSASGSRCGVCLP